MSFDIISALCEWVPKKLGVPCSSQVPNPRPDRFITVERTGGGYTLGRDNPYLAVQAWGASEADAYVLALRTRDAFATGLREEVPKVCSVEIGGLYNFPDPDARQSRYQLDAYLVTRP